MVQNLLHIDAKQRKKKKLPILLQRKKLYPALNDTIALFPGLLVIFTLSDVDLF